MMEQINESKKIYQGISMWEEVDDYYQIYFSNNTTLLPTYQMSEEDFALANQKLYPLLESAEKSNGILAMKDEMISIQSVNQMEANPRITINHNFLEVIPIIDEDGDIISGLAENKFYCLIPENHKDNEEAILEEVRDWIRFNQNIGSAEDEKDEGELELIYTQSDQKIFNFNSDEPQNSFSENPIIVIVYLQGIGPKINNLIANMSAGNYLFNDLEETNIFIQENGLENEFFGLVSVKDLGMEMLQQIKIEYQMKAMTLALLFIVFIVIQFFISYSYVELKKKKLFLQYIFGKNFRERHLEYLRNMLLLSMSILLMIFLTNSDYIYIVVGVMIFEISILLLTIIIAEKFIRLNVIKKED